MINISYIGDIAVPLLIFLVVSFAFIKKINVYSAFTNGVKEGIKTVFSIFPSIFALFIAVSLMRKSNLTDCICSYISPFLNKIGFPPSLVPFSLLRPVSGSGSLAFASDIFSRLGPDSFEGRVASVMMGSTETTFYTISVYFASCGIKNIRHTLKCALLADAFSMALSVIVCKWYF